MESIYKKQYIAAKLVLNIKADAHYTGEMFDLAGLRKLSNQFMLEYQTNRLVFFKGIPYRWNNLEKRYIMLTYYPEYVACMEYVKLPIDTRKSLKMIQKKTLKKVYLSEKDSKKLIQK